jgi:DNA modification methylase
VTPYYQDDLVTLYHGDCREWMPEADVIVTDPPYGINWNTDMGASRGSRVWPRIHGDDVPFDPAHILALRLPTVLFGANHFASRLPDSPSWWVWSKRVGMERWSQSDCELIWTNLGGPARDIRHDWWGGTAAITQDGIRAHPTQKPVGLMAKIIDLCPPGTILDPYMGSGTTLVAAKSLGRKAIGIEIEERYCEVAANRCRQEVLGLVG